MTARGVNINMKNRKSSLVRDVALLHGRDPSWARDRIREAQAETETAQIRGILELALKLLAISALGYLAWSLA